MDYVPIVLIHGFIIEKIKKVGYESIVKEGGDPIISYSSHNVHPLLMSNYFSLQFSL